MIDPDQLAEAAAITVREIRDHATRFIERRAVELEKQLQAQITILTQRVEELERRVGEKKE